MRNQPIDKGTGGLAVAQHQTLVNALFNSGASRWKGIYDRKDVYAVIHQQRQAASLALVDKLALPPGSRILEVGCGPGLMALALAQRGYRVQAIDGAMNMVSMARNLIADAGLADRVAASTADVYSLPFRDQSFDLLVALGILPWLASLDRPLQEIVRVLRPGAYLLANVDNPSRLNLLLDPVTRLRMLAGDALRWLGLRRPVSARTSFHSRKAFDACLLTAGFQKLDSKMLGFGPFTLAGRGLLTDSAGVKLHGKLQRLADRGVPVLRATGAQYLVLATKSAACNSTPRGGRHA